MRIPRPGTVVVVVVVAGLAAGSLVGRTFLVAMPGAAVGDVPTVRVARTNARIITHAAGELRSTRSAMIVSPEVSGSLRIVTLAPTGSTVKTGDVLVEFDPTEQEYALEQSRSELLEAEQEILKIDADAVVQESQDRVALLTARFDVKRAQLDTKGNEFVGAIDARKNELSQDEAERRLAQLEADAKSRALSNRAGRAVAEERRDKAALRMRQAQQQIANLILRAPFDGLVAVRENEDALGGIMIGGMPMPEYEPGAEVSPGSNIIDLLDVRALQIVARVGEADRANVVAGWPAEIRVNGLPQQALQGKVLKVGGFAGGGFFRRSAAREFEATFTLDRSDARLRPGMTARVTINGPTVPSALVVPRQCIFERDGKTIVYARTGGAFEPRVVQVKQRTEIHAIVEGIAAETEVALVDPTVGRGERAKASALPGSGGLP